MLNFLTLSVLLFRMICMVVAARFLNKNPEPEYRVQLSGEEQSSGFTASEGVKAWSPFILIFLLLMFTSTLCPPIHNLIADIKTTVTVYAGDNPGSLSFSWINNTGHYDLHRSDYRWTDSGKRSPLEQWERFSLETLKKYWKDNSYYLYVLWQQLRLWVTSGMISDIAAALVVVAGPFYPLISPLVGALGAFVTGFRNIYLCINLVDYRVRQRVLLD